MFNFFKKIYTKVSSSRASGFTLLELLTVLSGGGIGAGTASMANGSPLAGVAGGVVGGIGGLVGAGALSRVIPRMGSTLGSTAGMLGSLGAGAAGGGYLAGKATQKPPPTAMDQLRTKLKGYTGAQ